MRNIVVANLSLFGFIVLILLLMLALDTSAILVLIVLVLAYIFNPLVEKLENKFKIRRTFSALLLSVMTLVVILLIPVLLLPMLAVQLKILGANLPEFIALLNQKVFSVVNGKLNTHFVLSSAWLKNLISENQNLPNKITFSTVLPIVNGSLSALAGIVDAVLIPFVLFFVIKHWYRLLSFIDKLIPRRYLAQVHKIIKDIDKSLSYYLRGQIMVILVMVVYYVITLNIVGLPAANVIGLISGILVFIPYIGYSISVVLVFLLALTQFGGMSHILVLSCILIVGNIIENFVATPFLIGDSIGLNPVMIIFALIICGNLLGLGGIIAALPITAISVVLFKHLLQMYLNSAYYKKL